MEIIKAEKAGFCFGVENAVNKAFEILENNAGKRHVFSYGEIIHNDKVIEKLAGLGLKVVHGVEDIVNLTKGVTGNATVIIRAHGVSKSVIEQIENANKPLTVETLKDVAGGDDSDNYGYKNGYWYCLMGGTDAGSVFNFISQEASNLVLNVVFGYEGYKSLQAAKAAEAASLASEAAKGRATDFPDLASMDVDRDILTN